MANEIFEASAGFLVGTGEGAQVLLGGLARKCTVGRSSTPDQRRRAESVDMSGCARRWKTEVSQHRLSVRGSLAARRLAHPVTLCDGHGVFFVAASGQIQMAADTYHGFLPCLGGGYARQQRTPIP
jgi:hypothetical protein